MATPSISLFDFGREEIYEGHIDARGRMHESVATRFWKKVRKSDGCWTWEAATSAEGYGVFNITPRVQAQAHRIAYELTKGAIPNGLTLDHLCRNTRCVNPDHLEPTTMGKNTLRGFSPSAINSRKHSCHNGHPLLGANLYVNPRGERQCRICRLKASVSYRERQKVQAQNAL